MTRKPQTDAEWASRRDTCIILCAAPGSVRAAKSVVTRALRKVLGRGYAGAPWSCNYNVGAHYEDADSRWLLQTTDAEWDALMAAIKAEFAADGGWDRVPLDCYRD